MSRTWIRSLLTFFAAAGSLVAASVRGQEPNPAQLDKIRAAIPDRAAATPARSRKVLVFHKVEGFRHSCIPFANAALRIMGEKTGAFTPTFSEDMAVFDRASLSQYDAVIFNNTTSLKFDNPQYRTNLLDFVKSGRGVIGFHAASDNFPTWPEGVELMGGQFDGHPWTAGGTWTVKNDDPKHPLNASFDGKGFAIKDEIYQVKGPYGRDRQRVLLSLAWPDERNEKVNQQMIHRTDRDFAIAWIKRVGKGRVFYCELGHNNEIFFNSAIMAHYLAGIQYALGDFSVDDTPVKLKENAR